MAHSRLDRVGTIYSRITQLIRGGTMKDENIPIWYEVYKTFPPIYEPRYDRPGSKEPLRNIYYEEDLVRAKFHNDMKFLPSMSLQDNKASPTRKFLDLYAIHKQDSSESTKAYERAMTRYKSIYPRRKYPQPASEDSKIIENSE
ncbi:probable 28S ribosomal protein S23, mitochondrial [Colletes gigas]|uniref:probable 28S ribosomal protein S23, mitochondrial n=1 Tax=Colletes gigas TaxID=935657 RepID=UPI001C9B26C4|nr:probable 28S ribosomal protein S23, mitochondrial [Colletes gigas]